MKRYLVVAVVLTLCLAFSVSGLALAQEEVAQEEEETGYTWGKVSSVSAEEIVINEYDYDTGELTDVVYTLDANIELKNVDSLQEIAVGDSADIEYVVIDGKKVAKVIAIEKISEVEEQVETVPSEETEY